MEVETVRVQILPDGRMDTKNAAAYVGVSVNHLEKMRWKGSGPRFVKLGAKRVFYFKEDLDVWIRSGLQNERRKK